VRRPFGRRLPIEIQMSDEGSRGLRDSKEFQILQAMKTTLTDVIKDTATAPGLQHPLSDRTIENIRQCLVLITARERELAQAAGVSMTHRPRYVDEPQGASVVSISKIARSKKPQADNDE
jgi:hypothetical protein